MKILTQTIIASLLFVQQAMAEAQIDTPSVDVGGSSDNVVGIVVLIAIVGILAMIKHQPPTANCETISDQTYSVEKYDVQPTNDC